MNITQAQLDAAHASVLANLERIKREAAACGSVAARVSAEERIKGANELLAALRKERSTMTEATHPDDMDELREKYPTAAAEIARLRDALEAIAATPDPDPDEDGGPYWEGPFDGMRDAAREALRLR